MFATILFSNDFIYDTFTAWDDYVYHGNYLDYMLEDDYFQDDYDELEWFMETIIPELACRSPPC